MIIDGAGGSAVVAVQTKIYFRGYCSADYLCRRLKQNTNLHQTKAWLNYDSKQLKFQQTVRRKMSCDD
jgi:hypothetical protein